MANLKDIRRRIKSIQNTKKITQAMKMVSAAKVKRAENRLKANRPYAGSLRELFRGLYESLKNQANELDGSKYMELMTPRPIKRVGIIAISSDRGLCGSFNANVTKYTSQIEKRYLAEGLTPLFFLAGNKVMRSFSRYCTSEELGHIGNISAAPTPQDAELIIKTMVQAYLDNKIDAIQVLYTHFQSMISYKVSLQSILPFSGLIEETVHTIKPEEALVAGADSHLPSQPQLLLEPDAKSVMDTLIPQYLTNQVYIALLESSASELAARMTAMSNASSNASDLIDKFTIIYNKARQASITQEILEIVGGAEALG